jgi:predicted aspartyl protease
MRRFLTLMASSIALCAAAYAQPACGLNLIAKLDLTMTDEGRVTAPIGLNGKTFHPLVDTGAYGTIVSGAAAKKLGKKPILSMQDYYVGFAGNRINHYITVDETALGPLKLRNLTYMVNERMTGLDGLLGGDYFSFFDIDLDFAKGRLNVFDAHHCAGQVVYWTRQPYAVVPFDDHAHDFRFHHIVARVVLDGKEVQALIDTGAAYTVMSLEAAQDLLNVDPAVLEKKRGRYPFKTLSLGGVTVMNPAVTLVGETEGVLLRPPGPRMIVGMTTLRQLHMFVSYGEKKLYVTPATAY